MKKNFVPIVFIILIGGIAMWAISEYMKSRQLSRTSHCLSNLRQLDSAKEQATVELKLNEGDTLTIEQLNAYFPPGTVLTCHDDPKHSFNTSYSIGLIGSKPLCLINPASHTL